ncbi:hypothetical protein VZC37_18215 [Gordonia sp. LSe1-13]|uniref:Uncharacterized protein n=1 Tax=Gordonia sesuvii TaxID=3116777 RepID=A0ABU7MGM8_9ACTN|nr:hypothetical protein [Gordonia sp. LSe1-13]
MSYPPQSGRPPTGMAPPPDPRVLRKQAGSARTWAVLLWIVVALSLLSVLGNATRSTSGPMVSESGSAAESAGRVIGTLLIPFAAALGAVMLHRRRGRLLRLAGQIEAAQQAYGYANPGYPAAGYGTPGYPPGQPPQPYPPQQYPPQHYPSQNHPPQRPAQQPYPHQQYPPSAGPSA